MNQTDPLKTLTATTIRSHPVWFIRKVLGADLWEKQQEIVESVFNNPKTTVRACHAPGKTFTAGQIVLTFLLAYPDSIVLTTAPTWRQVEDMIWKEVRSAYNRSPIELGGDMLTTRYNISAEHFALGLSTDDPDKFQGYHAPHILIIVDESSGVLTTLFDAIEGIGSTGFVRILELGNPTDPTGHFHGTFASPFYNKISISCFDTPNFAPFRNIEALRNSTQEEREAAVINIHLITPNWVYERLIEWGENSPMFQSRCLGEFPEEGEDTLFPNSLFTKCVQNTNEGDTNIQAIGVDVARFGSDKTVLGIRVGNRFLPPQTYSKEDTVQTSNRVVILHKTYPYSTVNPDDIGVGGGVTDQLKKAGIPTNPINVGMPSTMPEQFANLRAEYYWALRARAEQGDLILPDDDDLRNELCSIKYKFTTRRQIQLESKDDMKKRGLHSPDKADSLMLAFAPVSSGSGFIEFYKNKVSN